MDHVALSLGASAGWNYLGGDGAAPKSIEVVVRSFDQDVEFAVGVGADAPSDDPVRVPKGEGRRLSGRHFFVRPTALGSPCRITQRGL